MPDRKQDLPRKLELQNEEEIKKLKTRIAIDKQLKDSKIESEGGKKLGKAILSGLGDVAKSLSSPSHRKRMKIAQLPADRSEIPIAANMNDPTGFAFIKDGEKYGDEISYASNKKNGTYVPWDEHYECKLCGYPCPMEYRNIDEIKNRIKFFRDHYRDIHKEDYNRNRF